MFRRLRVNGRQASSGVRQLASSVSEAGLLTTSQEGPIATLTLTRPQVLNALSSQVAEQLVGTALKLDRDNTVKVIILTGQGDKAFAAGADVKELAGHSYSSAYNSSLLDVWRGLDDVRKPLIAAVNGYALGGGCEVAMMCDIIYANTNAKFGQPELHLGVIPGMGATQRLIRAVGKSKAMEMILAGAPINAEEAHACGLVSKVLPQDQLLPEARKLAARIAQYSMPVVAKAKDCIKRSMEMPLAEGIRYEQREFWSCFALQDQKNGMAAYLHKQDPVFTNS